MGDDTVTLAPGQFTCGEKQIAQITGIPRGTVHRIKNLFESEQLIEQRTDRQKTLITVIKWAKYQEYEQLTEQRLNNDRTTTEQRLNTPKQENNITIEQDNNSLSVATPSPTPKEIAKSFFEDTEKQEGIISWLLSKNIPEDVARQEVTKFVDYWTEPTLSGKKVRWETEKAFDIRRRFGNWMKNANNFNRVSTRHNEPKGIRI